jgi:hypothetical protein
MSTKADQWEDLFERYTNATGAFRASKPETVAELESVTQEVRDFEWDDPSWPVIKKYCIETAERSIADARATALTEEWLQTQ